MKKTACQLVFFIFFLTGSMVTAFSQTQSQAEENPKEKLKILAKVKYPFQVYNNYKLTETTTVQRTYSDSSKKKYTREVTFFFTAFSPSAYYDDGFVDINISVDSLRYKFTEAGAEYYYDSQSDEVPASSFFDQTVTSVPLGRLFDMTYSPYGEVVKIEGKDIDWLINYVTVDGKDYLDTVNKHIWVKGVSDSHLKHLFDLQKGIIPYSLIEEDTVWSRPLAVELEGVDFYDDSATVSVENYDNGELTLKAKADSLRIINDKVRVYGIKSMLVDIAAGLAQGSYQITISPRGIITSAKAEYKADIYPMIRKDRFHQKVKTTIEWELFNQITQN